MMSCQSKIENDDQYQASSEIFIVVPTCYVLDLDNVDCYKEH